MMSFGSRSQPRLGLYSQAQPRAKSFEKYQPQRTMQNFKLQKIQPNSSKNTCVLGYTDILKIRHNSSLDIDTEIIQKRQEKLEKYQLSKQRQDNWTDTIHTLRKKKDNARFERFEGDEMKRRQIDIEEEIYQNEVKKKTLEKANIQLYEAQDRVRAFQGKLMLSDAMQERDEQLELKGKLKQLEDIRNQVNHENEILYKQRQEEEYQMRNMIREQKQKETNEILRNQRDQTMSNYIKRLQQEKIEDEVQKNRNSEQIRTEKLNDELRRERHELLQKEIKFDNQISSLMRQEVQRRDNEYDTRQEEFAIKKQKQDKMKQTREVQTFNHQLAQKQKLVDAQTKRLQEIQSQVDNRLNYQIKEQEIKYQVEQQKKTERKKIARERMQLSTQQTLRANQIRIQQEKQDLIDYQAYTVRQNKQIIEKERITQELQKKVTKDLQKYHKEQIEEKQDQRDQMYYQELEEEERIKKLQENDHLNFKSWASIAMNEWKADGKTLYPLVKELKEYRKKTWVE